MATNDKDVCETCRDHFLAHVAKISKGNPNVFVNVRDMTFPCRVPYFTSNRHGFHVARIKNCKTGSWIEMPIEEWRKKRQRGEL